MNSSSTTATPAASAESTSCPVCDCPPWCTVDHEKTIEKDVHSVDVAAIDYPAPWGTNVSFGTYADDHHRPVYQVMFSAGGSSVTGYDDMSPAEAPERLRALAAMALKAAEAVERMTH